MTYKLLKETHCYCQEVYFSVNGLKKKFCGYKKGIIPVLFFAIMTHCAYFHSLLKLTALQNLTN